MAGGAVILFYRHDAGSPPPARSKLPTDLSFRRWCPATDGIPKTGMRSAHRIAILVQNRLGCFANPHFTELSLWRGRQMLQRLILTPAWYRFPFMGVDDLQIGYVWTSPSERGKGLARGAIAEVHRLACTKGRNIWYVVDARNDSSAALIRSCGYRLIGTGTRTRPLGIAWFGQFRLERPMADGQA